MTVRFLYLKFVGLLTVILGFSYSLTSFSNFYQYLFGEVTISNASILVMMIGLLIPLYMLIFGIYLYFYADYNITKVNKFILVSALLFVVLGLICLFLKNSIIYNNLFFIAQCIEFLHFSIGYYLILLSILILFGCIKYKY